jgi:DNA (cytosine-5)-methyltransferase 1
METYFSIEQVSNKLNLSQKTIRRHIASGRLNSYKIGGVYRINETDVETFLKANIVNEVGQATLFPQMGSFKSSLSNEKGKRKKLDFVNWIEVDDLWDETQKSDLTFIDLFSGAGGITKGFEMAGLRGTYGLDNYEAAVATYERNFSHPICNGDITREDVKTEFVELVEKELNGRKLNIIAGGFPCQGFSMSGHRIVADPRNNLYMDMLEIVVRLQPDFVVMENVVGLRSMLGGGVEQKIIEDYQDKEGYSINVTTLCAADYGVPQKRNRVIFIANKIGATNFHPKPFIDETDYKTTRQAIEDLMDLENDPTFNHVRTRHTKEMSERIGAVAEGSSLYKNYSDSWKKCSWDEASCTIKENHGGVNLHPRRPRVLTAREMARIQTFPDDFIFEGSKSKQLVQIGNAVPPILAKAIGLAIIKSYETM